MATKTQVILIDDLDGGDAEESLEFGFEGVTYEVDLSAKNADKLRKALAPWIEVGRRTGGNSPRGTGARKKAASKVRTVIPDRRDLQKFAEDNGYPVPSTRGRIAGALVEAWQAAGSPQY